jgi:hypothetical protein
VTRPPPTALKDQNRMHLWFIIAANVIIFYAVTQSNFIAVANLKGLLTPAVNLLPVSLALIVTTVVNGLLSANMKARLVFMRWKHALPGHWAFSKFAVSDPRIDINRIKKALGNKMPADPEAENKAWYRIFKEVENVPEVLHVHREFLFMRDYTGFAALFFIGLGTTAVIFVHSWKISLTYCLALFLQFFIVRHAAATYGNRFVCTVLAVKSAKR